MKRAAGLAAAVTMIVVAMPAVAHADTTYRYWSYWVGGDTWSYSSRGPGFRNPPDMGVEGYRFVVSPKDGSQASPPGNASTYDQLCPGQPVPEQGQKRLAMVLDFGPAGIAPVGETPPATSVQCITVEESATGLQALQKVAQLRFHSSGLICGIAGFPATECPGQTARTATSTPTPTPTTSAPAAPVVPAPVVPRATTQEIAPLPSATVSQPPTPAPTSAAPIPADMPSPVALALGTSPPEPSSPQTPAWIAAIGATMIAALLGLAVLARRGRE